MEVNLKAQGIELSPGSLSKILKGYVDEENVRTPGGAVDFHKLASLSGINHETVRKIYYGEHKNPTWQTMCKLKGMIGFSIWVDI